MSELIMSMSGTRGIVGETLQPEIALHIGKSFGHFCGRGPVIVGGDTRTSHDMLKSAVISGLLSVGTDVIEIGKVPTPTVQQMIRHHGAKGGLVITASHNPVIWNGIKIMSGSGAFLDDAQYQDFLNFYTQKQLPLADWKNVGSFTIEPNAIQLHIHHILSHIDPRDIRKANLKVLVDANNGTGAIADPALLQQLGVQYFVLNNAPNGHFAHDPEPLKKNLSEIIELMQTGQYDIGFVQDADADRLVILDEKGRFIGEDYSLGICVDHILTQNPTSQPKVVVNLSTSRVLEDIADKHGAEIIYTKIGETHVTQALKTTQAIAGGEGNGGVIYPKIGWGRDSLVGIVLVLDYLAKSKKKVSDWVSEYPAYTMLREKVTVASQADIQYWITQVSSRFGDVPQNTDDGVKMMLDKAWVHVRPSNTEPIIRIFIEADSAERAKKLLAQAMG